MEKIYILKERLFEYSSGQLWASDNFKIKKVFKDKESAKKITLDLNLNEYIGCSVHKYFGTLNNRTKIWSELSQYINEECKEQLNGKIFDTTDERCYIPKLDTANLEKIIEIVGVDFYVLEETEKKNKWMVSWCIAETDPSEEECPLGMLLHNEYDSYQKLFEDICPILIDYCRSGTFNGELVLQTDYERISDNIDTMKNFVENSTYFNIETNSFGTEYVQIEYNASSNNPAVVKEFQDFLGLTRHIYFNTLEI